jgi:hypothetical protein
MIRLWQDRILYEQLSAAAIKWSAEFSFEQTTSAFRDGLLAILAEPPARMEGRVQVGN